MNTDRLYRVKPEDEEKLSQLLTECFSYDPLYLQLIPQNDTRKKLLPELMRCDLDEFFKDCEIYADSPDLNGIIVVSDASNPCSPLKHFLASAQALVRTGAYLISEDPSLKTLWNFIKGKDYLNSVWTDELGTNRRMHIVYFAVRPSMQGKGIASKMMKEVLHYADQHQLVTSLETHNPKNVQMYEHYGFELFEVVQKHFALKQFCMVR